MNKVPNIHPIAPDEEWKLIQGLDDKYAMSNYGRVYSFKTNKLRKLTNREGYLNIGLNKGSKNFTLSVSRTVGFLFVDGYFPGAEINHKDMIRTHNYYKNLEWCTGLENVLHANRNKVIVRRGTVTEKHISVLRKLKSKTTFAYDLQTNSTKEFPSRKECGIYYGVSGELISGLINRNWKLLGRYLITDVKK